MADYIDREVIKYEQWAFGPYNGPLKIVRKTTIDSIPAADVAPVVHGRWDGNTCTACKLPWNYQMVQDADDWGYFDPMPDYCPNCGARMECNNEAIN